MSNFICGSLKTTDPEDNATVVVAKQMYAETARLGIAIQLATTTLSENLPDATIRRACLYAASKINGNLIFNLLDDPLSNLGDELLNDLNIWDSKDPEEAPLMRFMKWLLDMKCFDSAAIFIELDTIMMEIAGELDGPDEEYEEISCTKEEFLQNLREYFPRTTKGEGEGLFIIQI